jgi:spore germination protein GerM
VTRAPRPAARPSLLAVLACLAATITAGCATVPDSGSPRPIRESPNELTQGQDFPQLIPAPPGKHWTPKQIVSGFLVASASFADAVARQYLAPTAQHWKRGWAVTVVSQPSLTPVEILPHVTGESAGKSITLQVSGQELATLTASGQYQIPHASAKQQITFKLEKINNQWRISNPPSRLLLSKSDFLRVYQPRNLYFFGPDGHTLVPDPVFVPLQATTTVLAKGLVRALEQRPLDYLQGVTQTSFPHGTKLLGPVRIGGSGATVNLGGTIARASPSVLAKVAAQLVWTLTSPSYGRPAIRSVRLEINGRPANPQHSVGGVGLLSAYQEMVPKPAAPARLYFVGTDGAVQVLPASGVAAQPEPARGQAGTGLVPLAEIAVSPPDARYIAGISPDRKVVHVGLLAKTATLGSWRPGGKSTSLSWDGHGDLWVVTTNGVWLRPPGGKPPVAVDVGLHSGDRVTALRVAPDGVRVAMVVRASGVSQVQIGAVIRGSSTASIGQLVPIGSGITDPAALSWYDPDNLIVLAQPGTEGATLDRVPVNGGQFTPIAPEKGIVSLATAGTHIVAGLRGGRMVTFTGSPGGWGPLLPGRDPAYPG